jgi:hypothetical protein
MSYTEAIDVTEESDEDLWHVQLASGDVCLMTLEQLDDAFQTGVIHENTYLWQEGATGWVTLRDVAGLDSDGGSAHQANGYDPHGIYAPPLQNMGPHSTVPVVTPINDMEFDLEPVSFKKKRSGGKMLFAAALIGAAGFGAVKYGLVQSPSSGPAVNAPAASPVPPSDMAVQPATPPPAVEVPAAPKPDPAKALAEKQKVKQQQAQQHRAAPRSSSRSRPSGGEKVFHKGGETGDPLNSAL